MKGEWSNGHFGVDDAAIYSTRGDFVVMLDDVAQVHTRGLRCNRWATLAAVNVPGASLDDIEAAFRVAIDRAGGAQPDWAITRTRMKAMRELFEVIGDGAGILASENRGHAEKRCAAAVT